MAAKQYIQTKVRRTWAHFTDTAERPYSAGHALDDRSAIRNR
jgi:hypothetical protein